MSKKLLTKEGAEKIKKKLEKLKKIDRINIIEEIKKTRLLGDLSENSEYKSAKEKQIYIENKIIELESVLTQSEVITPEDIKDKSKILFSATVVLKNLKNNNINKYKIVGDEELDMRNGLISINSPLALILIGKKKNDIVRLNKFKRLNEFEIISIEYI